MSYPTSLKYDSNDLWCNLDSSGTVTVGLTTNALRSLCGMGLAGPIASVTFPAIGESSAAGGSAGAVEGSNALREICFPVAGTVTAVNADVQGSPDTLRADPYGDGWLFKLKPNNAADVTSLMSCDAYASFTNSHG